MESINTNLKKCAYCNLDFEPHHGSSNYCCSEHRRLNKKKMSKDRYKDIKEKINSLVDETIPYSTISTPPPPTRLMRANPKIVATIMTLIILVLMTILFLFFVEYPKIGLALLLIIGVVALAILLWQNFYQMFKNK